MKTKLFLSLQGSRFGKIFGLIIGFTSILVSLVIFMFNVSYVTLGIFLIFLILSSFGIYINNKLVVIRLEEDDLIIISISGIKKINKKYVKLVNAEYDFFAFKIFKMSFYKFENCFFISFYNRLEIEKIINFNYGQQ